MVPKETLIVIGVNVFVLLLVLALQGTLPPVVPLLFGRPQGEEQLVTRIFLTLPPLVAIVIASINTFFLEFTKDALFRKILIYTMFVTTALSTIAVLQILRLVSSIF